MTLKRGYCAPSKAFKAGETKFIPNIITHHGHQHGEAERQFEIVTAQKVFKSVHGLRICNHTNKPIKSNTIKTGRLLTYSFCDEICRVMEVKVGEQVSGVYSVLHS